MGNSVGADEDARRYREGYPDDHEDDHSKRANIDFFENKISSRPRGDFITNIHKNWYGDYHELEVNHAYIQWIFPIREEGMNFHSQPIQPHEIKYILKRPSLQKRLIKSYDMMLDFYGMKISNYDTGEIERAEHWAPRYRHLSRSFHNYLRITRILKCLGELGYEKYKAPLVEHILNEIKHGQLLPCFRSCADYWIPVIRIDAERDRLAAIAKSLVDSGLVSHRSRDAYRRRRRSPSPDRTRSAYKPWSRGTRVIAKWKSKEFTCDVVGWDQAKRCYKVTADGESKWFRAAVDDVRLLNPPPPENPDDGEEEDEKGKNVDDMEDSQRENGDENDVDPDADGAANSSTPSPMKSNGAVDVNALGNADADMVDDTSSPSASPSGAGGVGSSAGAGDGDSGSCVSEQNSRDTDGSSDRESNPKALKQQKIDTFFDKK